ncbi:MAG: alpha-galactosidase [Spirochaetaceae bacterium]
MITVDSDLTIHLGNRHFSYAMQVVDRRFLAHLYWGAPLTQLDPTTLIEPRRAPYLMTILRQQENGGGSFSLDLLPQEYPAWGTGELREGAFRVVYADGTEASRLEYREHEVYGEAREPELLGLLRTDHELGNVETVRLRLGDPRGDMEVELFYLVAEEAPLLLRWARVTNCGEEAITIGDPASASVDLPPGPYDLVRLGGAWGRERHVVRTPLGIGRQSVASSGGASGHRSSPFVAVCDPDATEESGALFAVALGYSGNYQVACEVDAYEVPRLSIGINRFRGRLEPGERFSTPTAMLVYSNGGFNQMSAAFHRFARDGVIRSRWRKEPRQVVINSWEAMYFQVDAERITSLAREGRKIGAELLVLDDGWFAARRDDTTSLGDWWPNEERFPEGLGPVAEAVRGEGLDFGIWMEPEMVSPESELFRSHPAWALQVPGRENTLARNQLILDLSNPEVRDHLFHAVSAVLEESRATYVKWDMNRNMSEPGSPVLPAARQGEVMHRYILGLYELLERLTQRFPEVLFEGCAGGGGRFDFGLLRYSPRFWTSDQSDAVERLEIQYGTTMLFPPEVIGSHVSTVPNHQVGRTTPAETRVLTSLPFSFGFELDPAKEPESDRESFRMGAERFKELRERFGTSAFLRLLGPLSGSFGRRRLPGGGGGDAAWMLRNERELFVFYFRPLERANYAPAFLRLSGAEPGVIYRDRESGLRYDGAQLRSRGLRVEPGSGDYQGRFWHLEIEKR